MSQKKLSIDLGYGWIKAKVNGVYFRQPSVVGEKRIVLDDSIRPNDLIYDDRYFVGDLATRHSDIKYISTKDEKFEVWTTKVMLQSTIGFLEPQSNLYVVTGLPLDFYASQKEGFDNLLYSLNGECYKLKIGLTKPIQCRPNIQRVKIVPQHLGAAMDYLLDDNGALVNTDLAKKTILVIDPGYYTLGLLALDSMEVTKLSSSYAGLGVDCAYRVLQTYLKENIGKSPDIQDLDKYVLTREYNGYDIGPLIDSAFKALVSQIMIQIENLNNKFHKYILCGGCANYIAKYLTIEDLVVMPEPQFANIRGYDKIGARLWHF